MMMQTLSSGSSNLIKSGLLLLLAVFFGFALAFIENTKAIVLIFGVLLLVGLAILIFRKPVNGLKAIIILSFPLIGIKRYLMMYTDYPVGTLIDFLIIITFATYFIKNEEKFRWNKDTKGIVLILFVWLLYAILQVFNPESIGTMAWLLATRGTAIYLFLVPILTFLVFSKIKYLKYFIAVLGVFAILSGIKAIGQIYFGLDPIEQAWVDLNGKWTHQIWGKVRAFAFYSDAAVFGDIQSYTLVLFFILLLRKTTYLQRNFYLVVIFFSFIGFVLSGTRGAVYIPFVGFLLYGLIRKGWVSFFITVLVVFLMFGFLNYTNIGQSYSKIARVRSAFNYSNPSFQVRVSNQKIFWDYLKDKPFGGGAGSTSYYGRKFAPDALLSNTPPDSFYVRIWAEYGMVGIVLLLAIILYILLAGAFVIYRIKVEELKHSLIALWASLGGLFFVNLGNNIFSQFPIIIIISVSIGFIFAARQIEASYSDES